MKERVWDFINWRCRVQRYSDARFFSGWITDISNREIHVELVQSGTMTEGEEFQIEASCRLSSMSCRVSLFRQLGSRAYFEFSDEWARLPATAGARRRVETLPGHLTLSGADKPLEVEVLDISVDGAGFLLGEQIPILNRSILTFNSSVGRMKGTGLIRYCRPDPSDDDIWRAGIEFAEDGRPHVDFWNRLLDMDVRARVGG